MADLSHWLAQACEYHDSEGTFKVIYFQDRQELITVAEELLRNGDSWSDDLLSSNMGSNVYKQQVTTPSADTGSQEIEKPYPVPAGDNDLVRVMTWKLFDDLPGSSTSSAIPKNDISKATMASDVLVYKRGSKARPFPTVATNSRKNRVQEAKEEEKWYQKSIEQPGLRHRIIRWWKGDRQLHPSQASATQDVGVPERLLGYLSDLDGNPYSSALAPVYQYCKYALLFGITTEFNPSGVWVIEELFNDMQESDF